MTNTRDSDLDRIRETYAAYDRDGRDRLWDRTNEGYDRLKSDVETRLLDLIRVSLPDADAAILDVGCGDGDLAVLSRAAGIAAPWTGLDLLPSRIESAAKREPDARFVVGSADAMPFDDKVFQVVCAITLFSSLPSPSLESAVANEIRRVMRPGGWLVWHDLRYDNPGNACGPWRHGGAPARVVRGLAVRAVIRFTLAATDRPAIRANRPASHTQLLHAVPPLRSHLIGRLDAPPDPARVRGLSPSSSCRRSSRSSASRCA